MTCERDYVLRMIGMFGDMMRRLGELMDERERLHFLEKACREQCGMTLGAAETLDAAAAAALLPPATLWAAGEIVYLHYACAESDEREKRRLALQALRLLSVQGTEPGVAEARADRMEALLEVCREELCAQDELNCGRFFAACERFCAAEDMLFLAVEDGGTERACYAAQGLGVLTKMAALPRETLILGGLPYEEVTQAIDDIRRIGGL